MTMSYTAGGRSVISSTHSVNQDSFAIKIASHDGDESALVLCCDGIGGLARGELASATVTHALDEWFMTTLGTLVGTSGEKPADIDAFIEQSWGQLMVRLNSALMGHGAAGGYELGTTVTALLATQGRYHIVHVGDSRAYLLADGYATLLTRDQTLMAREIEAGNITLQEARDHPRRSTLLQCVGCTKELAPAYYHGSFKGSSTFLLCSDGFAHELSSDEIYHALNPKHVIEDDAIGAALASLIEVCQMRGETDDITAAALHARGDGC